MLYWPLGLYCSYCVAQLLTATAENKQNKTSRLSGRPINQSAPLWMDMDTFSTSTPFGRDWRAAPRLIEVLTWRAAEGRARFLRDNVRLRRTVDQTEWTRGPRVGHRGRPGFLFSGVVRFPGSNFNVRTYFNSQTVPEYHVNHCCEISHRCL